jgi:hypothetical protein
LIEEMAPNTVGMKKKEERGKEETLKLGGFGICTAALSSTRHGTRLGYVIRDTNIGDNGRA